MLKSTDDTLLDEFISDTTDLEEYQNFVNEMTSSNVKNHELEAWWAVTGLSVEASELMELYEKAFRKTGVTEVPSENVLDELGDVLWYAAAVANASGITLDDVIEYNISKLVKRAYEKEETSTE